MQQNTIAGKDDQIYLFRDQDYTMIRDWCLKRNYLFEDPYFELNPSYEWLRPPEIVDNPQLFVGGVSRSDIIQGELGDCWMLASIAALGQYSELYSRVIPDDQDFSNQYCGIFHFRFWQFGRWYDTVIDDRLPTKDGQLIFVKSVDVNEFWSALLEKAYCKILGGKYKIADAGNLCEALEDFTGGVVEQYLLARTPPNFADVMVKSAERHSLMGCFIDDAPGVFESKTDTGLVKGHSYTVTGAKRVDIPGQGSIVLIRARNPWGQHEWKGAWSDGSPEWDSVPESTKQAIGLVKRDDGEFWMSFDDWKANYQWLDMCHLSPEAFADSFGQQEEIASWQLNKVRGSWVAGLTAGGAANMSMNPQIKFTLNEADDENQDGMCNVLIALVQKKSGCQGDQLEIGFQVYNVDGAPSTLDDSFFKNNRAVASVATKMVREVSGRFDLPPGSYCVVPFTYEAGKEGEFMVRVYSEKGSDMDDTDYKIGASPVDIEKEIARCQDVPRETQRAAPRDTGDSVPSIAIDASVQAVFDEVSADDGEVDWRELKVVLDRAREESVSGGYPNGLGHFLLDSISYAVSRFFTSTSKSNAFRTVGHHGFSKELCRSMVALLDHDHSGTLGLNEFQDLWNRIKRWQSVYEQYCEKTDGYLRSSKLKDALDSAGYTFSSQTIKDIIRRYSNRQGKITFDDFLVCCIKVRTMQDLWIKQLTITKAEAEGKQARKAEFTLEQFMDYALYS